MGKKALLVGNSDGIGLATTKELLSLGWEIIGVSRSNSAVKDSHYEHKIAKVQDDEYISILKSILHRVGSIDLCIFCAGVGELLDVSDMENETNIFNVNLIGLVKTASYIIPSMVKNNRGHFIGLSSVADALLSAEAPSYHASKAGFSTYLESLSMALKSKNVYVTNVRFGFVDTKMAKGDVKPFMMTVEKAARHLLTCIEKKPVRYTAPRIVIPLVKFRSLMLKMSILFRRKKYED